MAREEIDRPRRRKNEPPSEGIGAIVDEITSSRLVGDALTRLVDAGERVMHAQQSAFSSLGIPSGSQFESLTLRVRTLFHRIDELEDDLDRLERRVTALENGAAAPARPRVKTPAKPPAKRAAKRPAKKRA